MRKFSGHFRISTMAFIRGDQFSDPHVRLPSLKGGLRWWWRAVAWGRIKNLRELHAAEGHLFGVAADGRSRGQARLLLRMADLEGEQVMAKGHKASHGQIYLMGQGVADARSGVTNIDALKDGITFTLHGRVQPKLTDYRGDFEADCADLQTALILMGMCGGVGARARRGYGSLTLLDLTVDHDEVFTSKRPLNDWQAQMTALLNRQPMDDREPPFTALSTGMRVMALQPQGPKSADEILSDLGVHLMSWRGYGRGTGGGHVLANGEKARQNFSDDHDLMLNLGKDGRRPGHAPERVVFGMPHGMYFGSMRMPAQAQPLERGLDRRASPLLLHVHQRAPGDPPLAVLTFLPGRFLPGQGQVRLKAGRNTANVPLPRDLWAPIHGFFNDIAGRWLGEQRQVWGSNA